MAEEKGALKDILNSGNTAELREIRNKELQRYQINKILLDILKSGAKKQFDGSTENLIRSLKILTIKDYIKLDNENSILGLNDLEINLSYTEKKSIKKFLIEEINKKYTPLLEYIRTMENDHPDILNPEKKQMEIIIFEQKKRETFTKLLELKCKKLDILKNILDIKLGPTLKNDLQLMRAENKLNQEKISLLNQYMAQNFYYKSDNVEKAVKEVIGYIDNQLKEE